MSFYVNESLFFDFYLNGVQLPLTLTNINSMVITTSVYDLLPGLRIEVRDDKNLFAKGLLADGSVLSIAVGNNSETALKNIMDFVLIGIPEEQHLTNANTYLIYGILNLPYFWKNMEPYSFNGSSTQVLQDIARKTGLTYEGISTSDEMVWLSGTLCKADFVKKVANYGWSNPTSCMKTVILPEKKLLYRDINALKAENTVVNTPTHKANEYAFTEINFVNKAGLYNYNYGYKTRFFEFDIQGNTKEFENLSLTKENSTVLNINKNSFDAAGLIRNELMPFNIGNTHANYSQAYYQNMRISALNSIKSDIYFMERTPINVLDKVKLAFIDPHTKEMNLEYASQWVVESKTMAISMQKYTEKLTITSTGIELDLFNNLI